jgi:DNA-binding CsgD family transcriptional regulator
VVATRVEVVGREDELSALAGFLEGPPPPRILLLEGEAGIGKTTLWREGVALGEQRALRSLACSPAKSETRMPFAAAGDLLGGLTENVSESLPTPQRRALAAALLLEEVEGPPPDPRAVALAFLGALRVLSQAERLLVAVDDVQWLDGPSAMLLEFALRRIEDEPVTFLFARRSSGSAGAPLGLDRAPVGAVLRLEVGPMSIGALHRLLQARLHRSFPRPLLRRLHEASGGNPFYALELARALAERDVDLEAGVPLPMPARLQDLVRDRIAGQPEHVRDALGTAAAMSAPTVFAIGDDAALDAAVEAELIELDGDRVRFTHPLLAAEAYAALGLERRRSIHRRLAEVVGDVEERARHLALAVGGGSDEDAAAALEDAARRAVGRGAPEAAAELLEHAVGLTPPDAEDDAARRALAAAYAHSTAGDADRADRILRDRLDRLPSGRRRAEALLALLAIDRDIAQNSEVAEQALREAGDDPALRAAILLEHSQTREIAEGPPAALRSAREGLRLAEETGDETLILRALSQVGHLETLTGGKEWLTLLERAQQLQAQGFQVSPWLAPGHWIAVRLMWGDELDRARELLEAEYRQAGELGDEPSRAALCFHLTQLETRAGRAAEARAYAEEGWALEEAAGREQSRAVNLYARALTDAHFGDAALARGLAEEALAVFERLGDHFFTMHTRSVLAFIWLAEGAFDEALAALEGMRERRASIGIGEPGIFPFDADEIEALVGAGRIDEAEALAVELEARGRRLDRARLLATGARCRGLVLAARGDLQAAAAALERTLDEHMRLPVPLELARTLLALGTIERRTNQKRAARESLEQALAVFEELGARLWAEKARVEIGRIGGRSAPRRGELTATERAIAELVAAGHTNEEVAAALSLSPRTVAWNLSKIYRKVGVRSRTELAAALARAKPAGER